MIISVIAGMGLIQISKGYVFYKKNSSTAQQGQIAMTRLKKEISNIMSVTSGTATSITFTRSSDPTPPPPRPSYTISWAGSNSPLLIDGDILVGPVTSFNLTYCNSYNSCSSPNHSSTTSIIEITLQLKGAEDTPINLIDRVNLYLETGG
jgi:hypothetical protein